MWQQSECEQRSAAGMELEKCNDYLTDTVCRRDSDRLVLPSCLGWLWLSEPSPDPAAR